MKIILTVLRNYNIYRKKRHRFIVVKDSISMLAWVLNEAGKRGVLRQPFEHLNYTQAALIQRIAVFRVLYKLARNRCLSCLRGFPGEKRLLSMYCGQ
ncbi:hypothetical protein PSP6_470009 [Paraburkholderia tropica]|nr:hypothetical protein PSP6_470009 [Paraburkholderia tropica]